jgi:hypothetical protein
MLVMANCEDIERGETRLALKSALPTTTLPFLQAGFGFRFKLQVIVLQALVVQVLPVHNIIRCALMPDIYFRS